MGTLYIVPTPIGNLQDITIRAIEILLSVPVIACEDTRRTGILLDHLRKTYPQFIKQKNKPHLISYYEEREQSRIPEVGGFLVGGTDVALVSDAGMPTISDPGYRLVKLCREQGVRVIGLPGPSSVILALAVSGLPTDKFSFTGYLPEKEAHAKKLLQQIQQSNQLVSVTNIIFASVHKIEGNLQWMKEVLGDIEVVIVSELTKIHETVEKKHISEALSAFEKDPVKGEYIVLWHA